MRRELTLSGGVLLFTVGLIACSGDDPDRDGSASTPVTASAPVPSSSTAATEAPATTGPVATSAATTPRSTASPTTVAGTTPPDSSAPPSTAPDTRPVDEAAQALASSGTLAAADFPAPWTQFSEGGQTQFGTTSCSYRPDGPTTLVGRGGGQYGPTMQFGNTGAFTSSTATAFPDAATAQAFIAIVNSDEWGSCRTEQLVQIQRDQGFDVVEVELTSRANDALGQSGFESYAAFSYTDAAGELTRVVVTSFYRLDQTVITVSQEYGTLSDADATTFFDAGYDALVAAYGRVDAL